MSIEKKIEKYLVVEVAEKTKKEKFEDSAEATDFFATMGGMIESKAMTQWCKATDSNFSTECVELLNDLRSAFRALENELESAS